MAGPTIHPSSFSEGEVVESYIGRNANNIYEGQVVVRYSRAYWEAMTLAQLEAALPARRANYTVGPLTLQVESSSSSYAGRAFVHITIKLIGTSSSTPGFQSDVVEEYVAAVSREPIETHPDFDGILADLNLTEADVIRDGVFIGFPKSAGKWFGVNSYERAMNTYRRTYFASSKPTSLLAKVGKIDTPPGSPTHSAALPGALSFSWKLQGVNVVERGTLWEVNAEWLSAEWFSELYG